MLAGEKQWFFLNCVVFLALACLAEAQCTVTTLAGTAGVSGVLDGSAPLFSSPYGVAASPTSPWTAFVADSSSGRIRAVLPDGSTATLASGFSGPRGIAIDANGTLFVAEYSAHRIRTVSANGTVLILAGGGSIGSANGLGTAARFSYPIGVSVSVFGSVYVADSGNNRVRVVSPSGAVSTLAGNTSGYQDGVGSNALFSGPRGLVVAATGLVYVSEWNNNRLRLISPDATVTTVAGPALINSPLAVAATSESMLLLANAGHKNVLLVNASDKSIAILVGSASGTAGFNDGSGTTSLFNYPTGVAVLPSAAGLDMSFLVTDFNNHLVRRVQCCAAGYFCVADGEPRLCPPGHFCPAGSTKWNDKNCGRGNYCPVGSSAPISCGPKGAIDPALGPANGPAFMSDVAACRNHCYNGAPGQLSTCE